MLAGIFAGTLILFFLVLVWLIALIWSLADIARQKRDAGYKIIWALVCIFFGLVGILAYYFVEVRRRKRREEKEV